MYLEEKSMYYSGHGPTMKGNNEVKKQPQNIIVHTFS